MSTLITTTAQIGTIKDAGGNATAMTIDSSGRVKMPAVPAWRVSLVNAQAENATGSDVQIVWDKSTADNMFIQGGCTLSSGIITVPVDGLYQVNVVMRVDSIGSGYAVCRIMRNNESSANKETYIISGSPASNYDNLTASDIFKCVANDTLRVIVYSHTDSNWSVSTSSIFSGHLVG